MYDQIREDPLYIILYTFVTAMAMMASCYLLLRRGNAFAADITTPARLRRWAALFFAAFTLSHVCYMPIYFLSSSEDIMLCDLVGGLFDSMTVFPLAIVILLVMLQDRRRALWPVAVMFIPIVVGCGWCVVARSYDVVPIVYIYILLMCIGFFVYMVRALRQYGLWLRDNYADLEHKEVWQSFVVLAIILLSFVVYAFVGEGLVYQYAMLVMSAVLVCYLLWRVETLSDLSISPSSSAFGETLVAEEQSVNNDYAPLLQKCCIDTQLYLRHDLSVVQLALALGTNRTYLGQYFSSHGTTYNAYINDLRINHFVSLYREAVAAQKPFTAQQLAHDSGYRSYSTFALAFKQRMGQSVMAWMHDLDRS